MLKENKKTTGHLILSHNVYWALFCHNFLHANPLFGLKRLSKMVGVRTASLCLLPFSCICISEIRPDGDEDLVMKIYQQPMKRVRRSVDSSANKKKSLQEAVRYVDTQIELHENAISDIVAKAVREVTRTNKQQNNLEVSYGLSVLAASVFYMENVVYGKPLRNYT